MFVGVPFAVTVLAFNGRPIEIGCGGDVPERGVFLGATGVLLAGLWVGGARGPLSLAAMVVTAAVAVWAAVDLDVAEWLADAMIVTWMIAWPVAAVTFILVLARRITIATGILVAGWLAVLWAVPSVFVVFAACGADF